MKKLFISMLAIAALASCAKEEVIVADQGELIGFNSFVENSTRAAVDPSYNATNLKAFKVWGTVNGGNGLVSIFNGDNVTGNVGSTTVDGVTTPNIWNCDVKQYWIKDAIYNFAALVNPTTNLTLENGLPTEVKGFTANGTTDLLYARSANNIVGKASGNGPVNFTFDHLLSKVKFTVINKSTTAEQYSFKVNNITITGNSVGDVTLATKAWDNLGTSKAYNVAEIVVDKDTDAIKGAECAQELLLIPGTFSIAFNVDIYNGTTKLGSQAYPISPATFTAILAAGNAYNFVINVAVGEEITFSVTQEPTWANGGSTTLI